MTGRLLAPLLLLLAAAPAARAQISPGELSAPHARLEGNRACLDCHRAGEGVDPELCLGCHAALAERVHAGRGLHASEEHRRCERCHSEHNGRPFALVYWPEGERGFDHGRAGWRLEGAHGRLECRACHRPERVGAWVREREPAKDLARTFLGLDPACASCHPDPHRGSMKGGSCAECHSQSSWKEARGFDHASTRFPLAGAHLRADCAKCHRQAEGESGEEPAAGPRRFDQFRDRALPACADCHRDPHAGRLGPECAGCHSVERFRPATRERFDHDRTAYPLRGRHRAVECARCHRPGNELRVPGHASCATCHRDPHAGQLARAGAPAECDSCHSVDGFLPARFGLAEHDRGRFPLAGAHRAVPCTLCHVETSAAELPAPFRSGAGSTRRYRFDATVCAACHRDPHGGELDRYAGGQGCAACHDEERWRPARFDHARSRFPLAGAHARVDCAKCHPVEAGSAERRFAGRPLDCAGCHADVHGGQFAGPDEGGRTDCARCHATDRFRPAAGFDHARTRLPLDGRHVAVPCARCHPTEPGGGPDGAPLVRYRPRPIDCAGCHAVEPRS